MPFYLSGLFGLDNIALIQIATCLYLLSVNARNFSSMFKFLFWKAIILEYRHLSTRSRPSLLPSSAQSQVP